MRDPYICPDDDSYMSCDIAPMRLSVRAQGWKPQEEYRAICTSCGVVVINNGGIPWSLISESKHEK